MKVFLSHSSEDKPFVERLDRDLNNEGIATWFDKDDIRAGDILSDIITQGITESPFFLVVISPDSVESKWVKNELDEAYNQLVTSDKIILPILYGNIEFKNIPQRLKKHLCIDFKNDYYAAFSKLLQAIKQPKKETPNKGEKKLTYKKETTSSSDLKIQLTENKTKEVLNQLLSLFSKNNDETLQTNAILQLSRLTRIEDEYMNGRMRQDNYNVEKARIDSAVLYLIKKIK